MVKEPAHVLREEYHTYLRTNANISMKFGQYVRLKKRELKKYGKVKCRDCLRKYVSRKGLLKH